MAANLLDRMNLYREICRDLECGPAALRVARALLFHFYNSQTGRCDPGRNLIMKETTLTESAVKRAIKELAARKWFEIKLGSGTQTRFGATSTYVPNFSRGAQRKAPRGIKTEPPQPSRGGSKLNPHTNSQGGSDLNGGQDGTLFNLDPPRGVKSELQGGSNLTPSTRKINQEEVQIPSGGDAAESTKSEIFRRGLAYLCSASIGESKARSMLGKWRRDHGDERTLAALDRARVEGASAPIPFIIQFLRGSDGKGNPARENAATRYDAAVAGAIKALDRT